MSKFSYLMLITVSALMLVSGCQAPFTDRLGAQQGQDPVTDISYKGPSHKIQKSSPNALHNGQFGYVHYKRDPDAKQSVQHHDIPKIDPAELADIITRLSLSLPDIHDVGTLVTDHDVLIGYKTSHKNRLQSAQQVKMSAQAVVPSYYHIYISDAPTAIDDIARYRNLSVHTPRVQKSIDFMIEEMEQSPQGYPPKEDKGTKEGQTGNMNGTSQMK